MKGHIFNIGAAVALILMASGCDMAKTYKKIPSQQSGMLEGSLKATDVEESVGGCERGLFVIEARKNYIGDQSFEINGNGFVNEAKLEGSSFYFLRSGQKDPTKMTSYKPMDLGLTVEMGLGGEPVAGSNQKMTMDQTEVRSTISPLKSLGGSGVQTLSFSKTADGKYVLSKTSEKLAANGNSLEDVNTLSRAMTATTLEGVGQLKSFSIGNAKMGASSFNFPPDVEDPQGGKFSTISAVTGEDLTIPIPAGAEPETDVKDFVSVEFHYPVKTIYEGQETDPTKVIYMPTPAVGSDGYINVVIPGSATKGLSAGEVAVDVTRHFFTKKEMADAEGGGMCVDARTAVRVPGMVSAPAKS